MPEHTTLYQYLSATSARFPDKISFLKRNSTGNFQGKSFASLKKSVDELCAGIQAEGIRPAEKIALFCDSSPNWFFTDLSIITSGCVSVPRGTDVTDEDIEYIINHAECRTAIVQNEKTRDRLVSLRSKIPILEKIYILEKDAFHLYAGNDSVQSLMEKGREFLKTKQDEAQKRIESVNPEELATLIYTSGTTGAPKGVMLNQRGWITAIQSTIGCVGITSEDRALSLLPPWHAFERAVEYAVIFLGAEFLVTDIKTLKEDLRDFKPTFFPSVPRIWESLYNGIKAKVGLESRTKQKLFETALKAGKFWSKQKAVLLGYNFSMFKPGIFSILFSRTGALLSLIPASPGKLLSILVFKKIHEAFGGNLKISISAGSALPGAVDEFLSAIGLTVLEGYGMTETSAVISVRKKDSPTPST
ncbi:MAG TPA: AMP-binding protein, partial [Leptospiraceae bacterium]|nr:AMP-binding protein [Leptospiraceae bacterium]